MEESFRLFLEECDQPQVRLLFSHSIDMSDIRLHQGIQLIYDMRTFGGFIDAFLNAFKEDVGKMDCLAFPILSSSLSLGFEEFDLEDVRVWSLLFFLPVLTL